MNAGGEFQRRPLTQPYNKAVKTVFFDVDTQLDFLFPAGALYVPGAERIIPAVAQFAEFAVLNGIPVIATLDAHTENDSEFTAWKPHCVVGTVGQQKPVTTLLPKSVVLPSTPRDLAVTPEVALSSQILLEKQHISCFTNPNLKPLLSILKADRYVVYGVVTEVCVQEAVLGLLALGGRVDLVTDAVRSIDQKKGEELFSTVRDRGGVLTTVAGIING